MKNSTALRGSSLAIWLCGATDTVLRGAMPEEYAVTDITAWSEAQLASLPHFDRYVPVAPAGAGGDFSPVAASGIGVTAGTRNPADSLGAFVNAGSQSDIAAWGTHRWSYGIWDGHDNHYYSGSVTHSPARDVNVFGQVVGTWSSTNTYHPFRRAPDGTFTDFRVTTPHSYSISPSVINNHGSQRVHRGAQAAYGV